MTVFEAYTRNVIPTPAAPSRVYFAVPDLYTIGTEFDTYAEARAYALTQIEPIRGCPGSFTRAFIDVREQDQQGDRPVARYEVQA